MKTDKLKFEDDEVSIKRTIESGERRHTEIIKNIFVDDQAFIISSLQDRIRFLELRILDIEREVK
jgi:hypothetical protein